jgi:hypothetical protein
MNFIDFRLYKRGAWYSGKHMAWVHENLIFPATLRAIESCKYFLTSVTNLQGSVVVSVSPMAI